MTERNRPEAERLGELLRRGDPARDLGPEEAAHLRGVILRAASRKEETRETSRPLPRWGLAWATAASIAVAAVVGWKGLPLRQPEPQATAELASAGLTTETPSAGWTVHTGAAPSEPVQQQVQFTTPGGTRIIWILSPDSTQDRSGR